jgi:geranylgeranyl diphosphate synthase type I
MAVSPVLEAPSCLAVARDAVAPLLRQATATLHPDNRLVAEYQLGWRDVEGGPAEGGGGKALRPTLCVLSARAAGGGAEAALPAAAAVELVHTYSLLHDDVMDRDRTRRHRPTSWVAFGDARAILAGDALVALALRLLFEAPSPRRYAAARGLCGVVEDLIRGQAADLALEGRDDVTLAECLAMVRAKTASLISYAVSSGALLAEGDATLVDALAGYGRHLGMAFQAVDDLLGIWGSSEVTGKPAGNDLLRGKRSLPVVLGLTGPAGRRLAGLLARVPADPDAAGAAQELLEGSGAREATRELALDELQRALEALETAAIPPEVRTELEELAWFTIVRDR